HGEDAGEVGGDLKAAAVSCTAPVASHKHSVSPNGTCLPDLPANVVPSLSTLGDPVTERLPPVELLHLEERRFVRNGFKVGCVELQHPVDFTGVVCVERGEDHLDVLLRHRLLLEAEAGGCTVVVHVVDDSDDAAIAEVEYGGDPRVQLTKVNSARFAT